MPEGLRIAPASFEDLADVSRIHVTAWKQAYTGQMPQAYLDSLDAAERLRGWQSLFPDREISGLLLARISGEAVGFVCFGRGRDEDRRDCGEIYAIYVLESYWRSGIGYRLHREACTELKNDGFRSVYLLVLDTNQRAIAAYLRWGGTLEYDHCKKHLIGGQAVKEVLASFPFS